MQSNEDKRDIVSSDDDTFTLDELVDRLFLDMHDEVSELFTPAQLRALAHTVLSTMSATMPEVQNVAFRASDIAKVKRYVKGAMQAMVAGMNDADAPPPLSSSE